MTMVFIQQVSKSTFIINRNKILIVTMVLFLFQIMLISISYALSNRLAGNKEDKQYMTEQLKLEIELDKKVYKSEEPIMIKGKIENLAKRSINLAPILTMSLLIYLKYEGEQKAIPLEPLILLNELIRKEDIIKLQLSESYFFKRIISKELHYIMPNKIGQYELYIIYVNKMENLEGIDYLWIGEIKSNVVELEIR